MAPEKKTPERRRIDLDAAREARLAKAGEAPVLTWKGVDYELPVELPARFMDWISEDLFEAAFDRLLHEPGWTARFLDEDDASWNDLLELAQQIVNEYGLEGDLGNLQASGGSSSNTSSR